MKKKVVLILSLLLLICGIYIAYKQSIKQYKVSYKISNYKVEEHYYKTNNHEYDIKISNKKMVYTYTLK